MTEEADNVVHLVNVAPGHAAGSDAAVAEWAHNWIDQIQEDGHLRSLIMIVELTDGNVYHLGQTTAQSQGAPRVLGLLQILAHKILHGRGHHPTLEKNAE